MKKLNNKGFTIVEGLLVLVIISAVVGLGFYAKNRMDDKASKAESSKNSALISPLTLGRTYKYSFGNGSINPQQGTPAAYIYKDKSTGNSEIVLKYDANFQSFIQVGFNSKVLPDFNFEDGARYKVCITAKANTSSSVLEVSYPSYGAKNALKFFNGLTNGYETKCDYVPNDVGQNVNYVYYRKDSQNGTGAFQGYGVIKLEAFAKNAAANHDVRIKSVRIDKVDGDKITNKIFSDNTLEFGELGENHARNKEMITLKADRPQARVFLDNFQNSTKKEGLNVGKFVRSHSDKKFRVCVYGKPDQSGLSRLKISDWLGSKEVNFDTQNSTNKRCADAKSYYAIKSSLDSTMYYSASYVSGVPFTVDKISIETD